MNNIQDQKCPNCTAPLRYDPAAGKLVCDFCGSSYELETAAGDEIVTGTAEGTVEGSVESARTEETNGNSRNTNQLEGFDFHSLLHQAESEDAQQLPVFVCRSCGAEILSDTPEFSLTCPFCSNNVVLTEKVSGKLRPDGILPFKITPDKLTEAVKKYYQKEKFIPRQFFSENVMSKVTGIYVPFWVFSGSVEGELYYRGEKFASKRQEGDYIYTKYDVYDLERSVSLAFEDIPVDASEKMDDAMMDSLEPFDMKDVKPFDIRYLAGFAADRFDVAAANIAKRAKDRMCRTIDEQAQSKATRGYSSASMTGSKLRTDLNAKYILLPVYQFDLEWASKKYRFAVNGQTGKVIGELPYDENMMKTCSWIRFFLMTAGFLSIWVIRYLLGG